MRFVPTFILLAIATVFAVLGAPGQASAASAEQVENAITRAKAYLYSKQVNGTWETAPARGQAAKPNDTAGDQWGGLTAIATYALLASGDRPASEPRLQPAIEFLKKADIIGIYALGMRAQVWTLLPQTPDVRAAAKKDAALLMAAMGTKTFQKGFYNYTTAKEGNFHTSTSQYGVLGMWAAAQAGIEVPDQYWQTVEKAWQQIQDKDGGWSYEFAPGELNRTATAAMTTAGVATLFITNDYLHSAEGLTCKGNIANPAIERGMKWVADHFAQVDIAYTWYGVERIGVASGYKYFGAIDWYSVGADQWIKKQGGDGSFRAAVPETAFIMLFLLRGRAPVILNKLEYSVQQPGEARKGDWNQRPRDAANLAHWLGRQLERDLNWQIVNLNVSVDDLHDSQILYISGKGDLKFAPGELTKLRAFVTQGGMILGNADCGDRLFATSFKKLGADLFPIYEFRELPATHAMYSGTFARSKWRNKPSVQGLSNGVRELMVQFPTADPSRALQTRAIGGKEELWHLLASIVLYSVEQRDLRYKGQTYLLKPDPAVKPNRSLKVARLEYAGNWDPEPGGWNRLSAFLHNQHKTTAEVSVIKLGDGKLSGYPLAHLTGTNAFKLSETQKQELKEFVAGGGTLVVDAAGGNLEFRRSAESELAATFLGNEASPIPPVDHNHAVYSAGGQAVKIRYRDFARLQGVSDSTMPRLRGIESNKRLAVIYSAEDLSGGLVGQPVDGINGYDPVCATHLMSSVVLYAAGPAVRP